VPLLPPPPKQIPARVTHGASFIGFSKTARISGGGCVAVVVVSPDEADLDRDGDIR